MSASDLTDCVQQLRLDGDALANVHVREVVGKVLNLVEAVVVDNRRLEEENQRLREIIRQLKGEPRSSPAPRRPPARDVSSEKERRQRASPPEGPPRADCRSFRDIRVDKEVIRYVDAAHRPPDATFIGYEDVVVQDLQIKSYNIRYRLELWDSPSQGRLRGELPPGVTGEYGPELKALLVSLKYVAGTSLPRAHEFVEHCGVVISPPACRTSYGTRRSCFRERRKRFSGRGWRPRLTSTSTTPSPAWEVSCGTRISSAIRFTPPTLPHRTKTD